MFNVMQMERPHRSGVLAVCIAYAFLYVAADLSTIGVDIGDETLRDLILCHLAPMLCIHEKEPEPKVYAKTELVSPLVYCPNCKVKKREDRCRLESRFVRKDPDQVDELWHCENLADCNSHFHDAPVVTYAMCTWDYGSLVKNDQGGITRWDWQLH